MYLLVLEEDGLDRETLGVILELTVRTLNLAHRPFLIVSLAMEEVRVLLDHLLIIIVMQMEARVDLVAVVLVLTEVLDFLVQRQVVQEILLQDLLVKDILVDKVVYRNLVVGLEVLAVAAVLVLLVVMGVLVVMDLVVLVDWEFKFLLQDLLRLKL